MAPDLDLDLNHNHDHDNALDPEPWAELKGVDGDLAAAVAAAAADSDPCWYAAAPTDNDDDNDDDDESEKSAVDSLFFCKITLLDFRPNKHQRPSKRAIFPTNFILAMGACNTHIYVYIKWMQ